MAETGRGAWPSNGPGGTLRRAKDGGTTKGPYYMLAGKDINQIGLHQWCLRAQGRGAELSLDENAVFHAVVGIQLLLNGYAGTDLSGDGIFGPTTDKAVRKMQTMAGITVDGVVGRNTMRELLLPVMKAKAAKLNVPWEAIYGILRFEGAFDPGAVGVLDTEDLGLAQINSKAHPHISFAETFCPSFAVEFVAGYLRNSMNVFSEDIRKAVASYNLGLGGTRQWVADGSPDVWMPSWSTLERKPNAYIDRILNAYLQD